MEDQEKWIKDVFGSIQNMKKAQPEASLFDRINKAIEATEAKIIPMNFVKVAAVAAIVLMTLNVFVLRSYKEQVKNTDTYEQIEYAKDESSSLINDYNIYRS